MPGMRGPDLVERLRQWRPDLPVLYMSGYSDGAFLAPDALSGAAFIQKPFSAAALVREVRRVVEGEANAMEAEQGR